MSSHVSLFPTHVYIFFRSRNKFFPVRYLKKKLLASTSRHTVNKYATLISHQIPHTITTCLTAAPFASNFKFNHFTFQQFLQGMWTSERSKFCHAICIFITLILHEITRTMTTKYLAERSPVIFEYEVNIRVSRRHSNSIKWNRKTWYVSGVYGTDRSA